MTHQLLKNSVYNTAAGVIRIAMALLTVPLLIRFLGLETYGIWAFISAVLGIAALAEGGLTSTTTIFATRDLAKNDSQGLSQTLSISFSLILGLATFSGLATYVSANMIVDQFINLPETQQQYAVQGLQLSSGLVWVRLMQQVFEGVEQAYQNYGAMNILNTIQWIALSLGLFLIAWHGGTIPQLMLWLLLVGIMTLLSHVWLTVRLLRHQQLQYFWNLEKARKIVKQSWMTWGTTFGTALFIKGDRIIVGSQLGPEVLGLYSAITDIASSLNLFSTLSMQPLMSALGRSISEKAEVLNPIEVRMQIQQAFRLNSSIVFGMAAILYSFAPWIIQLFIGNAVAPKSIFLCQVIILIYSIFALNPVGYYIMLSVSSVEWVAGIYLVSGIFSVLLIRLGASSNGLTGAVIGNASYLVSCVIMWVALKKLNLSLVFWFRTIFFPLCWFTLVIVSSVAIPNHFILKVFISVIFTLFLLSWFIKVNRINPKAIMLKLTG